MRLVVIIRWCVEYVTAYALPLVAVGSRSGYKSCQLLCAPFCLLIDRAWVVHSLALAWTQCGNSTLKDGRHAGSSHSFWSGKCNVTCPLFVIFVVNFRFPYGDVFVLSFHCLLSCSLMALLKCQCEVIGRVWLVGKCCHGISPHSAVLCSVATMYSLFRQRLLAV